MSEQRVVRLSDLNVEQRRVVLALVAADKSAKERSPAMTMIAEPEVESPTPRQATQNWSFKTVPVRDLKIDPRYHDPSRFSEKRANRIGHNWDDAKVGVITVSDRGADLILVDGVHRTAGAKVAGIDFLPAKVFYGLTLQQEADLFYGLSDAVRLTALAQFQALLVAGDEDAVAIHRVLDEFGVHLGSGGSATNTPNASRAITAITVLHHAGLLRDTLRVLREALPEDPYALNTVPLQGVGSFIAVYRGHPRFSLTRLRDKIAERSAASLIRSAKDIAALPGKFGTGSGGVSGGASYRSVMAQTGPRRAVLLRFNDHLRDHLPDATPSDLKRISLGQNPWADKPE